MKRVVFSFLGTNLDGGLSDKRWARWRPSVALASHDSFAVSSVELFITNPAHAALARVVGADIQTVSPDTSVQTHLLPCSDPWSFEEVCGQLHSFARGYVFDDDTEYFVHLTTGTHVAQICMFLLAQARHFPAKILETFSTREGADAWRGRLSVIDLDLSRYDLLATLAQEDKHDSESLLKHGIQTKNAAFNKLITSLERVAVRSTAPILLTGPTGAGKSQLASRIFDLRKRRHLVGGAFVEVNCATLRGDSAMSTLFGHKKGAFTGAQSDRLGLLRSADKGTLFLDEIGCLGLDEQAMLLRALEDKRWTPLGSDKEVQGDFQLIAGTNQNLAAEVAAGRFRADLLARLNIWSYQLPSLAERKEDLAPNLDYELERVSMAMKSRVTMNKEARELFLAFGAHATWTGNFRDLAAAVTRMATLCESSRITTADVSDEIARLEATWGPAPATVEALPQTATNLVALVLGDTPLDVFDQAQLSAVLHAIRATPNMADASRRLFAESMKLKTSKNNTSRLQKYLAKWNLTYADVRAKLVPAL